MPRSWRASLSLEDAIAFGERMLGERRVLVRPQFEATKAYHDTEAEAFAALGADERGRERYQGGQDDHAARALRRVRVRRRRAGPHVPLVRTSVRAGWRVVPGRRPATGRRPDRRRSRVRPSALGGRHRPLGTAFRRRRGVTRRPGSSPAVGCRSGPTRRRPRCSGRTRPRSRRWSTGGSPRSTSRVRRARGFRVAAGDMICIDNYRMFHGRDGYVDPERTLHSIWAWTTSAIAIPGRTARHPDARRYPRPADIGRYRAENCHTPMIGWGHVRVLG